MQDMNILEEWVRYKIDIFKFLSQSSYLDKTRRIDYLSRSAAYNEILIAVTDSTDDEIAEILKGGKDG